MSTLHAQIMNLPATGKPSGGSIAYKLGHRDARHAAAELALQADAVRDELLAALQGLMQAESRGRVMPIGPAWDEARAAVAKATGGAA